MQFYPGDVYNRTDHNLTLNRLINLDLFKFVKNRFQPLADTPKLDVFYYLTPYPSKSLRAEVTVTSRSNNLNGSEIRLSWRNRNFFKGGEHLSFSAYVGSDYQFSGALSGYNTYRLMESQGSDEEEAGMALGAGGWRVFFRITLPNIKWALLYGVILCSARAMGEFGAVSVLSGHIRGETNTMPLHVEAAYNDYNFTAAFAVATLLAGLALATLAVKSLLEWKIRGERSGRSTAAEAET
jgi:hypothetical protein